MTSRPDFSRVVCVALLGLIASPCAPAQTLESAVRACVSERDDLQRLSCYDKAAAALVPPASTTGAAAASSSRVPAPSATASGFAHATEPAGAGTAPTSTRAAQDAEFGMHSGPLAQKKSDTAPRQITAVVAQIVKQPRGQLVVTLDNGQVWQQNESLEYFPLNVGDTVRIDAAALGSYKLLAPSKRTTRVTRIR